MDITKLSLVELKALAYDIVSTIQSNQTNLNIVNEQIKAKSEAEKAQKETPVEKKDTVEVAEKR